MHTVANLGGAVRIDLSLPEAPAARTVPAFRVVCSRLQRRPPRDEADGEDEPWSGDACTGRRGLSRVQSGTPEERAEQAFVETASEIHERVITVDSHIDIPLIFATRDVDPGVDGDFQVDLPKMRAGGLDAGFFIVYVGQTERTPENEAQAKDDARTKFDAIHRMAEQMHPDEVAIAYSADDVERIAAEGKLVALIGIENGWVIGRDLSLVETYHGLGARYMTLAHSAQRHRRFGHHQDARPGRGGRPGT